MIRINVEARQNSFISKEDRKTGPGYEPMAISISRPSCSLPELNERRLK
jgi:hypothetical protein